MDRDRDAELARRLPRGAQQARYARLDLAWNEQAGDAAVAGAVHPSDERTRRLELLVARRLVHDAREPAPRITDPAARIEPRPEPGAETAALDLGEQRLLHAELAAELHERRGAGAQQLGHRERCVQARAGL